MFFFFAEAQNIRKSKIAELKSDIQDQEDSRTVEAKVALALNDTGDLSQRLLSISYVWSVVSCNFFKSFFVLISRFESDSR